MIEETPPFAQQRGRLRVSLTEGCSRDLDWLVVEAPLALHIGGVRVGVLMRTPGNDLDLGLGFALTEGLIERPEDLLRIHHDDDDENVLVMIPAAEGSFDVSFARRGMVSSSSCGLCGKLTIMQVKERCLTPPRRTLLSMKRLSSLPATLRAGQPAFGLTGGIHAAGLIDANGQLAFVREDIGRHNAVDKVVGAAHAQGVAARDYVLLVSGRCSLEIVQKAAMVGIGTIAAIGSASTLGVDLALELGITLCAFVSSERASIYSGEENFDGIS